MTKLHIREELKNTSELNHVIDFYNALFQFNESAVDAKVSNDSIYTIHGFKNYVGKPGFVNLLSDMKNSGIANVEIDNIVANDKSGAVKGYVKLNDGTRMAFCEFLVFTVSEEQGIMIKQIDSYSVPLTDDANA